MVAVGADRSPVQARRGTRDGRGDLVGGCVDHRHGPVAEIGDIEAFAVGADCHCGRVVTHGDGGRDGVERCRHK